MIQFIVGFLMVVAIIIAVLIDDRKRSNEFYKMYKDIFDEYEKIINK